MAVYRCFVEKRKPFAVEADGVLNDLKTALRSENITGVRVLNRYDLENIEPEDYEMAKKTILSEPQLDEIYEENPPQPLPDEWVLAVEYLPGQFDQRADSCAQCIQLSTYKERPVVKTARVYYIRGQFSDGEKLRMKETLINPVEAREAAMEKPTTIRENYPKPQPVQTLDGFCDKTKAQLAEFLSDYALAMDLEDIAFCQAYFKTEEKRDPTITEIRMIDTYWSDHCRHTTFGTIIEDAEIEPEYIKKAYEEYLALREKLYAGRDDKPITLMDIATIGAKALKAAGKLKDLDESEEINACSVRIKVDVDGQLQDWLLMFKNETHNHPTEIEPFGGAATCLGGAIRDPLSGRSYVYQAMRVTGAADPLVPVEETIGGKLPQRKIVTTAAAGYSSYGNQIGLATGHVSEIYHPGYLAKRMEIGAVVGAAPSENVVRERPAPGDVVILLGGKTGRDGCGGATGSSKSHTVQSLESCGAEVQKGNAPEERKLQRLFRNPKATKLIKRCNDFGAGGVSVAIGELADGLKINLSAVPKKYEGLDGTELAISESQERMAVVVAPENADVFCALAAEENLEATAVAQVSEAPRLVMELDGTIIVDLARSFLNSNGAKKFTKVHAVKPAEQKTQDVSGTFTQRMQSLAGDLNVCSQKGLVERFDSTIGAGSVLMPFGGAYQMTPAQAMAAKIPVLGGETTTCSLMSWGFDPYLSQYSPFHGAMMAVVHSVAKIVAAGGKYQNCYLTFQEYFERMQGNPVRWGKPFSALLGALKAQMELGIGSIGGKDSMSGTFEDIDVPPTLVSFAVSTAKTAQVLSPEFKKAGSRLYYIQPEYDADGLPVFEQIRKIFEQVQRAADEGNILSCWSVGPFGLAEGLLKMSLGNRIGAEIEHTVSAKTLFAPMVGGFLIESGQPLQGFTLLGKTTEQYSLSAENETVDLQKLQKIYEDKLHPVFPYLNKPQPEKLQSFSYEQKAPVFAAEKSGQPQVLIPVFPGTNCEYDTARAFEKVGAKAEIFVIRNRTPEETAQSVAAFAKEVQKSQIIAIPGGFSGGDEPEGSGKFITAFFRGAQIKDAVHDLLKNRDGLMCGICNGFQALVKLGLVPYGEIVDTTSEDPTLTFNRIGRHQSMLVKTRVASNKSPWLMQYTPGEVHTVAISHGEGRFVASEKWIEKLAKNGQIATQYVDLSGNPTDDIRFNPNGSVQAIEGITSPDGRIFGKMGHSERFGNDLYKNIPGEKLQNIFAGAVAYYK